MGRILINNAKLVLEDNIAEGALLINGGKIEKIIKNKIEGKEYPNARIINADGYYLSPGFIESHVHGGGLCDFSDGSVESFETAIKTHLLHGATTIFPTLVATSREEIEKAIISFDAVAAKMGDIVNLPGLHLEGPYLSPGQKGALPEQFLRDPDPSEYKALCSMAGGVIKRWTLAPERKGAFKFIDYLVSKNIVPSIGHSNAEYHDVVEAYKNGCNLITHLYSAMSTIVRRGGFRFSGIVESAFCIEGMNSEIIADGAHVPFELLNMVWRLIGKNHVILTTDASRCAGSDVKRATIGSLKNGTPIIVEDGVAKLLDRSAFGGSIATPERLIKVMWKDAGVPLCDAVRMYTYTPAKLFGIDDAKGCLKEGLDADLVCFNDSIEIKGVFTGDFSSGLFQ